ncbi:MAG: hypothetical protein LBG97_03545, partial [Coriobacteriales bacterium]|nr:hypothetical protein [Coriobacteriales bacterium]
RALEAKAYLSALALTLTLPDICGKAAYPFMKSRERYRKWYDENIGKFDCRESCNFPVCDGVPKPCQNPDGYKSCNETTDPLYCSHYCDTDNVYVTADMCWQLHCAFFT